MKIGFFDSGLGGLTILQAVSLSLPQYGYYFYGDTKHLPYGDKSEEEIYRLTTEGVRYLFDHKCAIVILACNTASAETARRIQTEFVPQFYPDRKVLGMIVPTMEELVASKLKTAVLLGTTRTVDSKKYEKVLAQQETQPVSLIQLATPELVPLIESGKVKKAAEVAIKKILNEAPECEVVVLACTHYTQLKEILRERFVGEREIISQDEVIPNKLASYLKNHAEIEKQLTLSGERTIHLTEHRPDYDQLIKQFLNESFIEEK